MICKLLLWALRRVARPFNLGHIYGADGSLYMERFNVFYFPGFAMRLHHIVREDRDRHLHDHPWNFTSVVLAGGYIEERPITAEGVWCSDEEVTLGTPRVQGSWAKRHADDRHKISRVAPGTWTLFITGRYRNQWGFYTPKGKIYYRDYLGSPPKSTQ